MAGGNLPITILVLGGGVAMVWVGISNPSGGLVGEVGRILRGEKATAKPQTVSAAAMASAIIAYNPGTASGDTGAGQGGGTLDASYSGSNAVATAAAAYLGTPYVYGGGGSSGPSHGGFDCSGLTQYAEKKGAGIDIPRVAETQRWKSTKVASKDAVAGDLVFFGLPAYHCGVYTGGGKMIHAPHTGTVVKVAPVSDVTPGPVTYGRFSKKPSTVISI